MSRGGRQPLLSDVARAAGVAPITVSRVINGRPHVTDDKRARVLEAIERLGYRSNMAARALAGGKSRLVGVVATQTEFYGPLHALIGIEDAAQAADHSVTFVTARTPSKEHLSAALDRLRESHVDGAIVIAPFDEAVAVLGTLQLEMPIVVTSTPDSLHPSVGIDQAGGARMATAHLLELGHATVHHVAGPVGWSEAAARREGWQAELRSRRLRAPAVQVGDWSPASGYRIGRQLASDPKVTAVFVANDQMALGVLLALREAGRDVPGDVSVVGFDDIPEAAFFAPPLTTVRQDFAELGRLSVAALFREIADEGTGDALIAPTLVVRATTAPPR